MKRFIKFITLLVLLPSLLVITLVSTINVRAKGQVVRVGWFDSSYNIVDEYGRRSGYSYEYQQSIALYTGFKYEYVTGSWSNLLQMLIDKKIDVLSDVSYTKEREEKMIFASIPMGTEDYYLYKSTTNKTITIDDYSTFNGKKIGVNKDSIMVNKVNEWKQKNNINADIIEITASVDEALIMLNRGEIDLFVNIDGAIDVEEATPLVKIGSSDFYFAIRKDMPELAMEIDQAMAKILDANPYYNSNLHLKYFKTSGANLYLSDEEKAFINNHGKIKVGYQDNYLAFCAKDSKTGELTGTLKDYLDLASDSLKNAHIDFEAIAYPTANLALEALKKGEIDFMFPANLSAYDGEIEGLFMTNPIIRTEIVAVVPEREQKNFLSKDRIAVAVNAGNVNYELFLKDNFPAWKIVYFANTDECLKGISEGKADCLLISNYRFNNLASKCVEYNLVNLSTGVEMDYYFAVNRDNVILYSILNKIVNNVPSSSVNSAISHYYTEDAKADFGNFFNKYFGVIMITLAVTGVAILALIFVIIFLDRKSKLRHKLIKATEIDDITGLYNKTFFYEYANNLYKDSPTKPMDAAIINVIHFTSLKDSNGIDFMNQLLKEISDEIKEFLKENDGIAGYSMEGRFAVYYSHNENYHALYDRIQEKIDVLSPFVSIRIRMGVMPWESGMTPQELCDQAIKSFNMTRTEHSYLVIYDDATKEIEKKNQKLIDDLRRAIDNKEFKVYYQPKYDVSGKKPIIIGAEALLRWHHPEYGVIKSRDYIPLFEKNGDIGILDRYFRNEVVKQIALWKKEFGFNLPITVNVSRLDALDQTFEDSINILIDEYEIDRNLLTIGINESALINNVNQFAGIFKKLRKYGYKVLLNNLNDDDLSLSMMSTIEVDAVAIDESLIRNIDSNEKNITLIKLLLSVVHTLNAPVIALGINTKEELDKIKEIGFHFVEGSYLSEPLQALDFIKLIKEK